MYAYTYNADGLRSSKTVNGTTTTHIWDGDQITLEINTAGNSGVQIYQRINLIYTEDAVEVKNITLQREWRCNSISWYRWKCCQIAKGVV